MKCLMYTGKKITVKDTVTLQLDSFIKNITNSQIYQNDVCISIVIIQYIFFLLYKNLQNYIHIQSAKQLTQF